MSITLLSGDCRDVLPTLAANSVHTCVTSPPYYALRSYLDATHPDKHRELGSEATPDEYLATMVEVMREVKRVLRPDGTLWLNIGDSYFGTGKGPTPPTGIHGANGIPYPTKGLYSHATLKSKDLMLMPARLALALQADGWWVRSDIIWAKPNPMPESVTDRPTSAYEHVFLLTKSARYFYDAEAVREQSVYGPGEGGHQRFGAPGGKAEAVYQERVSGEIWNSNGSRNLRNVWTIATHAYPQAHFATYPPELAERCIRAGTSERGCCSACGAPWRRTTDTHYTEGGPNHTGNATSLRYIADGERTSMPYKTKHTTTTGWSASCACNAPTQPCTVLDPFAGAGTTLLVADRLQRNAIGIELNAAYTTMAMERVRADAPLFVDTPEPQPVPGFAQPDLFAEAAD